MAEHLARQYLHKHIADAQTIFDLRLELATQQVNPALIENAQLRSALAEKEECIKDLSMRLEMMSDSHEIEMAAVQLKLADKQAKQDVEDVAPWSTPEDYLEYSSSHGHVSALTPASSTSDPTSDYGDEDDVESMEHSKTSLGSEADGRNLQTNDEVKSESKPKQENVEERQVETDEEAGMSNGASSDPKDIEESDVALQQVAGPTAAGLLHTEVWDDNGIRTRPSAVAIFSSRTHIQVIEGYAERVERLADLKESIVRGTSDAYINAEYKRLEKVCNEHLKTASPVPMRPLRFDGTVDAQLNEIVEDTFKSSTRVFRAANKIFPDNKESRIKEYLLQAQDYLVGLPGFENKAYMKPIVTSFMQKVAANLSP
ncbi:hypothetical protein LTR22_014212 [Elasticomyces elasticus]|nr:hypothetical protein LTR22_014212 [Elasticomyces elasticus]KAK4922872.1 hypothetical protein LTR49_009879 [Elasticomyces elasticus]